MIRKFVLSAGRKIRKLARAGRLRSQKLFSREVSGEAAIAPAVVPGAIETESPIVPVSQPEPPREGVVRKPRTQQRQTARPEEKAAWTLDAFEVDLVAGQSRFHDFDLPLTIMHGIADLGFRYCTPIQEKALPEVLAGHDLIGKANTGTGKSAVFLIAILARLLRGPEKRGATQAPRALIIAPTRELVMQIAKDGKDLAKYTGLQITAVYGGVDYQSQMEELRRKKTDIIVATPGRLLDFVGKNVVVLEHCEIMVIDEADRMLDMGFIPDVRRIIGRTPKKELRQTLLFSATVSEDVKHLASQWCVQPRLVEGEVEQVTVDTVDQLVYLVTTEEKYTILYNLIQQKADERIIVFANMKNEARRLSERLQRNGIACALLSGEVAQAKRMSRLENFRSGKVKVLVATDVAGRGIHIEGISHVVNYTLPYEPEDYVHRIGRTGRAGAAGTSVSFACEEGAFYLPSIEEFIGRKLDCVVPDESLLRPPPKGTTVIKTSAPPQQAKRPAARRRRPKAAAGSRSES
ncbi:MAG: DEAD/DEAH box helicase [Desulfobulbaceae bacterium]|nr:MAG: DEAD/DEAH box helicase [Desulfobulbaceae bacterium]